MTLNLVSMIPGQLILLFEGGEEVAGPPGRKWFREPFGFFISLRSARCQPLRARQERGQATFSCRKNSLSPFSLLFLRLAWSIAV
jgi:hypothetical protein